MRMRSQTQQRAAHVNVDTVVANDGSPTQADTQTQRRRSSRWLRVYRASPAALVDLHGVVDGCLCDCVRCKEVEINGCTDTSAHTTPNESTYTQSHT